MRHLSVKEIHPHNLSMLEEQIEKAEKVWQWSVGGELEEDDIARTRRNRKSGRESGNEIGDGNGDKETKCVRG